MADSARLSGVCFLLLLVTLPASLVNFFAAIRGILVLRNAPVREEFGRPGDPAGEGLPGLCSRRKLAIGLAGRTLVVWFFLVLSCAVGSRTTIYTSKGDKDNKWRHIHPRKRMINHP